MSDRAKLLALFVLAVPICAQQPQQTVLRPQASIFVRPYQAAAVPAPRLGDTNCLRQRMRAGIVYLAVRDAIACALENNLDLEIDRYGPLEAQWSLERLEAGGALRGVTSGNSVVNQITTGQGVLGSVAAAGLLTTTGTGGGNGTNAVVSQIGPITPNLDPVLQNATVFSHTTAPQPNTAVSQAASLIDTHDQVNSFVQQGLLTGGFVQATVNYSYLSENAPTDVLNPTVAPVVGLYIRHQFLQGFGVSVNNIYIRGAQKGVLASRETFRSRLLNTVSSVLNLYWDLVTLNREVAVRQSALEAAQKTLEDTRKQIELGALARVEAYRAETGVAARGQELAIAQANVRQQETLLKNALSRDGLADPEISQAALVPVDTIEVPESDDLPPLRDLVARALKNRPDVALMKIGDEQQEIASVGTANVLLPTLVGIASASDIGQGGKPNPASGAIPPAVFVGGPGTAFAQVFRRNYPTERAAVGFQIPFGNRQAQGDYGVDQLQLKQGDLIERRDLNQIVVAISSQTVALRQARARFAQASASRVLKQDLLEKEQQMFSFGSAGINDVVAAQAELLAAQSAEISAQSAYRHARSSLDQVLGETLERNHVSVDEALNGKLSR